MFELKHNRRSVRYVEEKAASLLPTKSGALGPVIAITIVEAALSILDSSGVSHLGCPVRASPVLQVVSAVAIASRELEVGVRAPKFVCPGCPNEH